MAKQMVDKADWTTIDPESLSEAQQVAYREYKAAYAIMKEARQGFEARMQAGVPEGCRMVCGYNFGKLSVAVVVDDQPVKRAKAPVSLVDYLANMR